MMTAPKKPKNKNNALADAVRGKLRNNDHQLVDIFSENEATLPAKSMGKTASNADESLALNTKKQRKTGFVAIMADSSELDKAKKTTSKTESSKGFSLLPDNDAAVAKKSTNSLKGVAGKRLTADINHKPSKKSWWSAIGVLEYTAFVLLIVGAFVLSLGAYRLTETADENIAVGGQSQTFSLVEKDEGKSLAEISASLMTIPSANASLSSSSGRSVQYLSVFPYTWKKFIDRLIAKNYSIVMSQALHPRLYMVEVAKGVELNLLLSQNEKEVEEVSLRIHLLEAQNPVQTYRKLVLDLQDLLVGGDLRDDKNYFKQLDLPLNLYAIPLPYSVSHESPALTAELQILDPIYLNLRFVPHRTKSLGFNKSASIATPPTLPLLQDTKLSIVSEFKAK